jgi:hypothetical protein
MRRGQQLNTEIRDSLGELIQLALLNHHVSARR